MTLTPECEKGHQWTQTPQGTTTKLNGINAYIAVPSSGISNPNKILFLHDIFGWTLPNSRLLCDKFAERTGMQVILPDFYNGRVWVRPSVIEAVKNGTSPFFAHVDLDNDVLAEFEGPRDFLFSFDHESVVEQIVDFTNVLKSDGSKVFATGYCWGGRYAMLLAGKGVVDAYAGAHPSLLEQKDASNVKCPGIFLIPSGDGAFPDTLRDYFQEHVKDLDIEYFDGVSHGFAVRGDPNDPVAMKARDRAFDLTCNLFVSQINQ